MKNEKQVKRLQNLLKLPVTRFEPIGFDIEVYFNNQKLGKLDREVLDDSFTEEKLKLERFSWYPIYNHFRKEIDGLIIQNFGDEMDIVQYTNRTLLLKPKSDGELKYTIKVSFDNEWAVEEIQEH